MLNAEFIQRTGHGKYKRLITIPNNISSSLMQELAYNTEKRNKIMMILTRCQDVTLKSSWWPWRM